MQQNDSRNTLIFVSIAVVLLMGYQFFIVGPQMKKRADEEKARAPAERTLKAAPGSAGAAKLPRAQAKAATARVPVDTPELQGSINLRGGRIDDLFLTERKDSGEYKYAQTLDRKSPPVELLRPEGAENAWFVDFGWVGDNLHGLPGPTTQWTVKSGDKLTPTTPVVLGYTSPQGLEFTRKISITGKHHYVFTIEDSVVNAGGAPVTVSAYSSVQRQGLPKRPKTVMNVHEGAIGVLSDGDGGKELRLTRYSSWQKKAADIGKDGSTPEDKSKRITSAFSSKGGWLGVTDQYWLAAVAPDQGDAIFAEFGVPQVNGVDVYNAKYAGPQHTVAPGARVTETTRLFAGPKVVKELQSAEKDLGIPDLDKAVDWGMLWFLTRPFFQFLEFLFGLVGNFGIAILITNVIVRSAFFPLSQKQYESMTRMKKLQKPIEELRAKYKDDPAKLQQEQMALFQREKVNPLAGCIPILLTMPIFLALNKVLAVTIEMRHAPFFGYIRDLSAPEPLTILNLFGLIPWDVAKTPLIGGVDSLVHMGPLPLLYGFTMWLTTAMSPPATDPTQQRIFQMMPLLFTFIMAGFPSGLLLYWTCSNLVSIVQQYMNMRKFGVDNPIDDFIARIRKTRAAV